MPAPTPRLTLQVSHLDGQPMMPALLKVFDERGGTIGRAAQNDWVLPDPARFLSAHHATVYFEDGRFRLVDCSTNGIYLNGEAEPVGPGRVVTLAEGDRLQFGDYEIGVSLAAPAGNAGPLDPLQLLDAEDAVTAAPRAPRHEPWFDAAASASESSIVDPLALLGAATPSRIPGVARLPASERDDAPLLASFFQPPAAAAPVPEDWFRTGITPTAAAVAPAPAAADSLQAALDLVLQAAGLDPARRPRGADPAKALQTLGGVLHEALAALRELMLQRAARRQGLGLAATCIAPRDNNPLKFAARGVGEVIDSFLFDQGPACLDGQTAIRQALHDLQAQRDEERSGLMQGLRAQLDSIDPQHIERACGTPRRLRFGSAKTRCWSLYVARHAELRRQLAGDAMPRRQAANSHLELIHGLE